MRQFLLNQRGKVLLLWLAVQAPCLGLCQDAQVSQPYAVKAYLNPAFTGQAEATFCPDVPLTRWRLNTLFRNQYNGTYRTLITTMDAVAGPEGQWGFGAQVNRTDAGSPAYRVTTLSLSTAYKMSFSKSVPLRGAFGIQANTGQRSLNMNGFVYPDQWHPLFYTGTFNATKEPGLQSQLSQDFFDVALGGVLYSKTVFFGMSYYHAGYSGKGYLATELKYPARLSFQAGGRIALTKSEQSIRFLSPILHYKTQTNFHQGDLGLQAQLGALTLGGWYRGMITEKSEHLKRRQSDAIVGLVGLQAKVPNLGLMLLGISYDVPIQMEKKSFGPSLEFTLGFQPLASDCKRKRVYHSLPCPEF